jgi:anaerobic ribonucleoside-triphosphate reductase activating protein
MSRNRLNVANIISSSRSLGPGSRGILWVQGCPFSCLDCLAPEWIHSDPNKLLTPDQVVEKLLDSPDVTGLTFSGGEPMQQAFLLAQVARLARLRKDLNIICFTGYRFEDLGKLPPESGVFDLLNELDVLIDGAYIQKLNSGKGLRGSDNQRIFHFTERLKKFDLENWPRQVEVRIHSDELSFIGIPPLSIEKAIRSVPLMGDALTGGTHERI